MYVSVHAVAGTAVGVAAAAAGLPGWGAFVAGVLSHGVLDRIPHHDYKGLHGFSLDFVIMLLALWAFHSQLTATLGFVWLWGALGGAIPDLEVGLRFCLPQKNLRLRYPSHSGFIRHPQINLWPGGVLSLSLVVVLSLWFVSQIR